MRNYKILIIIVLLASIAIILFTLRVTQQKPSPAPSPEPVIRFKPSPKTTPFPIVTDPKQRFGGVSEDYKKEQKEFIEQTPILQKLPATSPYFGIEYISEQSLVVHSKTEDKERDYQVAKDWFAQNNIDISKIQIDYK